MTTLAESGEAHPAALVTTKVYEPVAKPVTVVVVPVPLVVPPGFVVNVHVPVAGRPVKTTLPVATVHAGCVTVPIVGAAGVAGCALITMLAEPTEIHPEAFVTV